MLLEMKGWEGQGPVCRVLGGLHCDLTCLHLLFGTTWRNKCVWRGGGWGWDKCGEWDSAVCFLPNRRRTHCWHWPGSSSQSTSPLGYVDLPQSQEHPWTLPWECRSVSGKVTWGQDGETTCPVPSCRSSPCLSTCKEGLEARGSGCTSLGCHSCCPSSPKSL